jgi:hypothetical protein
MTPHCECALLHADSSVLRACNECGITCCRSCAVEVDSHAYCRWCSTALAPAVAA